MKTFFDWLETLNKWQGVGLYVGVVSVACGFILWLDRWCAGSEERAIKRRDAKQLKRDIDEQRKREWELMISPFEHIDRHNIDPSYRSNQFSVPRSMRDFKRGTHS